MHYTFVLAPPSKEQAMKYVEVSQKLYADCQPSYLLTDDGSSSPHITVVQFDCESAELAHEVWLKMCEKMREINFTEFSPPFTGMAFVEGSGPYAGTTWVELSVARDAEIMNVHYAALDALKHFNLKPLNAIENKYRPHLTIARIELPSQMNTWSKFLFENPGNFKLEFGMSDEKWQYAKSLHTF